ncbi:MAG TPA: hypothetical protein VEA58_03690 [Anaerovoracaceae bacterium]|nr:hypothetical protein [Anaerovoracaceae bacterium]
MYIVERVKQRSEAFGNALKALHPGNAYYCGLKDSVKGAYPYIDWVEMTVVDTTHRIGAVYERQRFFLHRADSIWKKHLAEVAANEISWNKMHIVYKNEGDHFLFWFDHDAKDPLRYDTAMGYRGPNVDR